MDGSQRRFSTTTVLDRSKWIITMILKRPAESPSVGSLKLDQRYCRPPCLQRLLVPIHVPAGYFSIDWHPVIDECQKREPSTMLAQNSLLATFDGLFGLGNDGVNAIVPSIWCKISYSTDWASFQRPLADLFWCATSKANACGDTSSNINDIQLSAYFGTNSWLQTSQQMKL